MAPELKEIANAKLADLNQAYTALQEPLEDGEPSQTIASLPARAELLERLRLYNQASAPVLDESETSPLAGDREESDEAYDADDEDLKAFPYRPTSSGATGVVVFCIFVLLIGGALWLWHFSASEQETHAAAEVSSVPTTSPPEQHIKPRNTTQASDVPPAQTEEVTGSTDSGGVAAPEEHTPARDAVLAEIDGFTKDMRSNDADKIAAHFAERVDRYYLLKDLTRADVRASLASWFARGNRMLTFELQEPVVHFATDTRSSVRSVASSTIESAKGNTESMHVRKSS